MAQSGNNMAKQVQLIASYWTLAAGAEPHTDHEYSKFSFQDRVTAAAQAGFTGFGIWHADLEHTLKTQSLRDMRRTLDDNGMTHIELAASSVSACCSRRPARSVRTTSRWEISSTRRARCRS